MEEFCSELANRMFHSPDSHKPSQTSAGELCCIGEDVGSRRAANEEVCSLLALFSAQRLEFTQFCTQLASGTLLHKFRFK